MIDQEKSISVKKQAIIEAAATLFREKGYPATSMRDLAERVSLKVSSLYSHIGSKEEILRLICFASARQFLEGMEKITQQSSAPEEQISLLLDLHLKIAIEDRTSVTVFNDEWRHLNEPWLSEFLQMRRQYEQKFQGILEQGIANGVFWNIHPRLARYTILNALRWIHASYKPDASMPAKTLEEDIKKMLLQGLYAKPTFGESK